MDSEQLEVVTRLWQVIQQNWAKENRFDYAVVPSDDIRDKSLDEVKAMAFRVGITADRPLATLNVQQLTALFLLVADQSDQMKRAAAEGAGGQTPGRLELQTTIPTNPSDQQIASVLSQIQFHVTPDRAFDSAPERTLTFTARMYAPPGADLKVDMNADRLPDGLLEQTVVELKRRIMAEDSFTFHLAAKDSTGADLVVMFRKAGDTAGYFALARGEGGKLTTLHAVCAMLPKIDRATEAKMLDALRVNPNLNLIDAAHWDDARDTNNPIAAMFFTSDAALNEPLIHKLLPAMIAAHLGQFGGGADDGAGE